jgi:hypothetical protein
MLAKKGLMTSPSAVALYIEDAFSTYLYDGNGTSQTITNNIDLSGEGGLVWIKGRSGVTGHRFTDTVRGATKSLASNSTVAQATESTGLTAFSGTGFTIGDDADYNTNTATYCSWTFRKAEKFFDVVTYTGNGTAGRTVNHNLGSTPGCIMVKRTDTTGAWYVYHRSNTAAPETDYLLLNTTDATADLDTVWNDTAPTSTVFSVGTNTGVNANTGTYVAYLFAHDAGGFGDDGDQSVIKCGSYTGNGSTTGPTIDLGWEPQWVLIKQSTQSGNRWTVTDNMRGFPVYSTANQQILQPHNTDAEVGVMYFQPTATGFKVVDVDADVNSSGSTYIYIAIRRGPMKTPEAGTEVYNSALFSGNDGTQTYSNGFPTDFILHMTRNTAGYAHLLCDRLRGRSPRVDTTSTSGDTNFNIFNFDQQNSVSLTSSAASVNASGNDYIQVNFKRAPGFFDIVCYSGTGTARTVTHNLGAIPEMIIVKRRDTTGNWRVYHKNLTSASYFLQLHATSAQASSTGIWNGTAPTSSVFSVGADDTVNLGTGTYVAYLFGSVSGVSSLGTYTGTGTTLQVNCGFAAGARFVLIKRTDSTGDWYVWDTARGIVSGNDPYLLINSTAVEVTNTDYIDTYSSGFEISSTAPAAINANGGTFIYLAIA